MGAFRDEILHLSYMESRAFSLLLAGYYAKTYFALRTLMSVCTCSQTLLLPNHLSGENILFSQRNENPIIKQCPKHDASSNRASSNHRLGLKIKKGKPRSQWGEYAVKQIKNEFTDVASREVQVMRDLCHPNLIRLVSYFSSSRFVHIVTEYAKGGDLHSVVASVGPLERKLVQFCCAEVVGALDYIHTKKYVFGDLKPENVFLMEDGHAKIGDFGAARKFDECKAGAPIEGTPIYLPPEVLQGKASGYTTDWWGLGCLIFHLLSGGPPTWVNQNDDLEEAVNQTVQFDVKSSQHDVFPDHMQQDAKNIVTKLLDKLPDSRLGYSGAEEVKCHEFFRNIQFKDLHKQKAPKVKTSGAPRPSNSDWSRRSFSIMHAPIPSEIDLAKMQDGKGALDPIVEKDEYNVEWKTSIARPKWRVIDKKREARPKAQPLPTARPPRSGQSLRGSFRTGMPMPRKAAPALATPASMPGSGRGRIGRGLAGILAKRKKGDFIKNLHHGAG